MIHLPDKRFTVRAFNCRTGEFSTLVEGRVLKRDDHAGPGWVSPHHPPGGDWAFLITASE